MRVAHAAMFLCNVLTRNVRPVHRAALRAALPQAIQVLHAWGHDVSHCMARNNMLMPIKSATHPPHHSAFCVCKAWTIYPGPRNQQLLLLATALTWPEPWELAHTAPGMPVMTVPSVTIF